MSAMRSLQPGVFDVDCWVQNSAFFLLGRLCAAAKVITPFVLDVNHPVLGMLSVNLGILASSPTAV